MAARDIHEVLDELAIVVAQARRRRSRLGYFAALYRQVTLRVRDAIDSGQFDDGDRMSRFDAVFANRYLDALAAWQRGDRPSRSWEVTFAAVDLPNRTGLQHLLLGINAHINLDLAVAAAQHSPGDVIAELRDDFYRINAVLAAMLDPAQRVMAGFSPLLRVLDAIGARTDEAILDFSIQRARDHAVTGAAQR